METTSKNVFAKRDHYLAKLAQKLYFYNLANNSGALDYILDSANKEESKELLLALLFLSKTKEPLTKEQLDLKIEK